MNIFVYGLSYRARRENLAELFEPYGEVKGARIIVDTETRKSKGYGFVEMSEEQGNAAIEALNGTVFFGRTIYVSKGNERPPKERKPAPAGQE
jgi:RNA-binding proteins (RRM domain)